MPARHQDLPLPLGLDGGVPHKLVSRQKTLLVSGGLEKFDDKVEPSSGPPDDNDHPG